ncbi:MAG: peptidase [candidate division Zixibacteria bacterium HGW-Zixibacteria-1]|nr:MAG: peptidase [candidate division Zixibacteria bacterium HGW-Zixibacteria-1]
MKKKTTKKKKRLLEAADICRLNVINSVAISPDETKAAYTMETVSDDKKKYFSRLFVADIKSGDTRQYTFGEISDHSPVWSPDGSQIAFISSRNKKSGIYVIPTTGGAERKLLEKDGSFSGLNWTPDGKELVFAFRYNDSHEITDEKEKKEPPLFRHITRLFYRLDGLGFLPKDRNHIWKVDVASGSSKQLTTGKHDEISPTVSPDGKWIAFISNRSANPDLYFLHDDLFIIPINGGKEKKIATPKGPMTAPLFSPDGKRIAYIGHDNPDDAWGVTNTHIWTVGINGRPAAKDLMPKYDRHAYDSTLGDIGEGVQANMMFWTPDGKKIYFSSSDLGSTHIFYVPSRGGLPTRVTHRKCHIRGFSMNGRGRTIAAVFSDLTVTTDLLVMPPVYQGDIKARILVSPNKEMFAGIDWPKTKELWFKAHDGLELQGWLVTPPGFNKNRKYPAILEIHGGPRTQYGFTFFHEMLLLATKGYVVFYTNPRGGVGRGETFADAITGCWGEIDYLDCMSATDFMEKLPFVNKNKLGVTGGSCGGFMTNWIVGHTNRFRAAVTQRSVVNLESFFGSSDMGYDLSKEFKGYPWTDQETYRKYSPLTFASKIKTPLLIIHSENDLRCSIEQAEQLFATLMMMKKKVEFIRFPGEPHGLSRHGRPDRRIARLNWILKWFDRYLK